MSRVNRSEWSANMLLAEQRHMRRVVADEQAIAREGRALWTGLMFGICIGAVVVAGCSVVAGMLP